MPLGGKIPLNCSQRANTLPVSRVLAFQRSQPICRMFQLRTYRRVSLLVQWAAAVNLG